MLKPGNAFAVIAWLVGLALVPLQVLRFWRVRARDLFQFKEPHIDFFFFHETKAIYLNLALMALALGVYFFSRAKVATPSPFWDSPDGRETFVRRVPLFFFVAASLLALPVYQNTPLSLDEYAAVFQAQVFAAGRWYAQFDAETLPFVIPRFLQNYFFTVGAAGRVVETYLPGHALLLAPFAKLNVAWLFNPLLGALILWGLVRLAQKHFDGAVAFWALLFALASPILWVNSVSFYSLNCRLLFNLAFLYFLLPGKSPLRPRDAVLAGLCGGMAAFSHNPFPHVVFALPWLVYFFWRKDCRRFAGYLVLGYLPFVVLCVGWYGLLYRYQTLTPESATTHFTYAWDIKSALKGPKWKWTTYALWSISLCRLLLWCAPGIWIFFFSHRAKQIPWLRAAAASFLLTVLAYSLARNRVAQGFGWGHRYSYASLGGLFLVAAAALADREKELRLRRTALTLAAGGILFFVPLRLIQIRRFISSQRAQVPCLSDAMTQVCFLDTWAHYFMGDRAQNDPFLKNPRLIFHSQGAHADAQLMRSKFPGYLKTRGSGNNTVWVPGLTVPGVAP